MENQEKDLLEDVEQPEEQTAAEVPASAEETAAEAESGDAEENGAFEEPSPKSNQNPQFPVFSFIYPCR